MDGLDQQESETSSGLPKSVFVFGASARALAESAARAGVKVVAADLFADWDTQRTADQTIKIENYPLGFPSSIEAGRVDYSIFTGGLENHPEVVSRVSQKAELLGNPAGTLDRLLDFKKLFHFLGQKGFTVPPFYLFNEMPRHLLRSNRKMLAKRSRTAGGHGVEFASPVPPTQGLQDQPIYYQPLISGEAISATLVAWRSGGVVEVSLIGISRQLQGVPSLNAQGFSYCGSVFPFYLSRDERDYVLDLGKVIATEYELIGLFNIDLIRTKNELYFLEVNPRYSASMELIEHQCSMSLFEIHYWACATKKRSCSKTGQAFFGETADEPRHRYPVLGKAIWYADRDLQSDKGFCEYAERQTTESGLRKLSDIPSPGTRVKQGSPAFTVFEPSRSDSGIDEKLVKTAKMVASRLGS
ncbi:MAG: ATP-grasp domain-containing protein [Planctomycetota bacterium]|nr:ATP-grasp domain-containing protein [Planctomycetota bacterium]